jgi:hypothetical protein
LVAVGWLSRDVTFVRGEVATDFFEKLSALCRDPWQPVDSMGFHVCDLCQFEAARFALNVFILYGGKIYVAPVGIVHYIAAHWYRPPEVFINAVLACPPMNSMEYKRAVLSNGGRSLV